MDDSQVDEFCAVTGTSRERAEFFLQAAAGNLQAAIDAFYGEEKEQTPPKTYPSTSTSKQHTKKSGFTTLSDYQSTDKQDKDEEEGEKYYAGGSEHSGQLISGPPRKKKDLAKEVFEAAKQQGAVPIEEEAREQSKSTMFHGQGFRLGDTEGPSDMISGASTPKPKKVRHTLRFWKDGFSVDDGPLRNGQSPEDRQFLESISKGEIPQELIHAARGEVDIDLEDKRTELYVVPKPKLVAFSGAGHKLGNITPDVHVNTQPTSSTPVVVNVSIDSSQPVTSVQIRLADGSRLQSKFNHTHTVGDIRKFIIQSRPETCSKPFLLLTTFPRKELTDDTQTLSDAQLLNAVVVQRFQ